MNNIKVKTLVERLSKSDIQNVQLHFEGTVGFDIEIKSFKIKKTVDTIEIYNKQEQKVVLNVHQIMKITEESDNKFKILFDGPQIVNICVKN